MKIKYKYEIKNNDKINEDEIINKIIETRKIKNKEEFLNPPSPLKTSITDFGFKKAFSKTIKILEKVKANNETVVIYTDYDADGITGGAILWETLYLLGFKVMPYVPHRKTEGYGFSIKGIDNVKKQFNPKLIISVDHGITGADKIAYAKTLGIATIITDHHLKPDEEPKDAAGIFHIPQLSGSGVAYFFAKEIFGHFKHSALNIERLTNYFSTDYLGLAAIGTIADLVPLTGTSRGIVKYGLDAFFKIKRHGIKCILKQAGIDGKEISPYEVGFIIAPRINAIGRLEHAIDALRLLCTTRLELAQSLATRVGDKNKERQELVKDAVEEARFHVKKDLAKGDKKIIFLISDDWHEGIIGLIASRITEEFYRPVIVMTKSDGFYKGSARSIPSFHITDFLRSLKEYLIDVGGHKQAAGFSIEKDRLKDFIIEAQKEANKLIANKDLERIIETDIKIPLAKVTLKLARLIEKLQPFGIGNSKPAFFSEVELVEAKLLGKNKDHLKIYVKDPHGSSFPIEMIAFGEGKRFFELTKNQKLNIIYQININRWGRVEKLQGLICYII